MRIISAGIQHETNTFSNTPTTLGDFIRDSHLGEQLEGGQPLIERYRGTSTIHGGYLLAAEQEGVKLVPVLNAKAYPSGMVDRACFDRLKEILVSRIQQQLPADGILLDLHGAMVSEDAQDAEAEIVRSMHWRQTWCLLRPGEPGVWCAYLFS